MSSSDLNIENVPQEGVRPPRAAKRGNLGSLSIAPSKSRKRSQMKRKNSKKNGKKENESKSKNLPKNKKTPMRAKAERIQEEIAQKIMKDYAESKNKASKPRKNSLKTYSEKLNCLEPRSLAKNYLLVVSLVISFGSSGYYQALPNILAMPMSKEVFGLEEEEQAKSTGLFNFFLALGAVLACISVSKFLKHIGRVKTFLLVELLKILTALLFTIKSLKLFSGLMIVIGFLTGIQETAIMVILRELLPPKISDKSGFLYYIMTSSFTFMASFAHIMVGGEIGLAKYWRAALSWPGLLSVFSIFGVLSTIGFSETPEYHIDSGKELWKLKNKVFETMSKIYTKSSAEKFIKIRLNELKKHRLFKKKKMAQKRRYQKNSQNESQPTKPSSETMGRSKMFSKRYNLQLFIGLSLAFLKETNGNSLVLFFSNQIFDDAMGAGKFVTLILSLGYFSGAVFSYCSINLGRRTGLLVTMFIHTSSLFLIVKGIEIKSLWLVSVSCYILLLSYTCGMATMRVYLVDILPPFGIGMSYLLQWIAFMLTMHAPTLIGYYGTSLVLYMCIGIGAFQFLFTFAFCFETKGMSKEEIEILFNRGKIFCRAWRSVLDQSPRSFQEVIRSSQFSKESLEVDIKISIRKEGMMMEQIETHRSVKKELLEADDDQGQIQDSAQENRRMRSKKVGKFDRGN